jgi:aminomethyltransferase
MEDISAKTCLLALSGPHALQVLQKLTTDPIADLAYYAQLRGTVAGIANVIVATTGYTGERTFELYVRSDSAVALWNALMEAGQAEGIQPCGLAARDTLRMEMGYMLYGNDISDQTNPLEAGLGWITKLTKESDFVGKKATEDLKTKGLTRRLVGFHTLEKGIPRRGYKLLQNGAKVGEICSGTFSPSLKNGIGMAYVNTGSHQPGTKLDMLVRNKTIAVEVVKPPFVTGTSLQIWQGK